MCADYIADGTFSGFVAGQNGLKDALGDSVGSHCKGRGASHLINTGNFFIFQFGKCSFLSGLMNNTMKDLVEKNMPVINRINPAALISDAFYCINVYDDMSRYYRNLFTLAVMSITLVTASFLLIRRESYDSI